MTDSESIAELSGQFGYSSSTKVLQGRMEVIMSSTNDCVFVATKNEEVIGWIHGFYTTRIESNSFVEIGGLVVDQKHRKEGVGKRLVEKVEVWANSRGCDKLRVRCNVVRKETHVFYEKMGFDAVKEQRVFDK